MSDSAMIHPADSRAATIARRFRHAVIAAVSALVALVFWWLLEAGVWAGRILLATVLTAPLWLMIPYLNAGNRRSYALMTLVIVPYMVLAITEAVANPHARGRAAACLFVGFALFVMSIAYLRVTRPAVSG